MLNTNETERKHKMRGSGSFVEEGLIVGRREGVAVGFSCGAIDGIQERFSVGFIDGWFEGPGLTEGGAESVGIVDGCLETVGCGVDVGLLLGAAQLNGQKSSGQA